MREMQGFGSWRSLFEIAGKWIVFMIQLVIIIAI